MDKNNTDIFIDGLYSLSQEPLSAEIISQAKKCLLDYLGGTLAGAKILEKKGNSFLDFFQPSSGTSRIIGLGRKTSLENAVFFNGLNAHVAELDDGERFGMIHPGAPIFSTLLPLAEKDKINGGDFLRGSVVGYEAALRLAGAIQPSHKEFGFHATGTCGTTGAAIAVASALKLSKKKFKNTFSASVSSASGILKVTDDLSELKPFNSGRAALNGLFSVFMARSGFEGPKNILDGEKGFFSVFAPKFNPSMLERRTGDQLTIKNVYFKPYAACRHAHPAIEATLKILKENDLKKNEIKKIKIITYRFAIKGHDHTVIDGPSSAKMSIPYSVAAALNWGKAGLEEFGPEKIRDPEVIALTKKVEVVGDKDLDKQVPNKRPAVVEIETLDGKIFKTKVELPKGEPENPLSLEDIEEKFLSLAGYAKKTEGEAREIINYVEKLESNLVNLFPLL